MRGFSRRTTVEEAIAWVDAATPDWRVRPRERVAVAACWDRSLAVDVTSGVDVPGFDRAMMDGYALRADDTAGASSYNRLPLRVVGEAFPGAPCDRVVRPGEAVRIMTGAPLPQGADAVAPAEQTEGTGEQVFALEAVSPGKHVGRIGEDVRAGEVLLAAPRRLRPQDAGALASVGCGEVEVVARPTVGLVVSGDELLSPGSTPVGCQIVDANGPMLAGLVARDGGRVVHSVRVPDDRAQLAEAMQIDAEIVLVAGGSSVGQEDHAPRLLDELGELAIHGVAMRPSSPAGMGRLGDRLVFLLPGNPVSCLCAYDFFAGRAIRAAGGRGADWPHRRTTGTLSRKLVSVVGRCDYARVLCRDGAVTPLAIGGASVLSSTTRADGFVIVDADSEGRAAGDAVEVFLYDG